MTRPFFILLYGLAVLTGATALGAQSARQWTVDPKTSLVWWQIDPHYSHLWSTTCPKDPSWQPGEGRDAGWDVDYKTRPVMRDAGRSDPRVPLFPRVAVHPVCRQAVHGGVTTNGERWEGARGTIKIEADSFETGMRLRDVYARDHVLESADFPTIDFTLDSLVSAQAGDTIRAIAVGTFILHGVHTPQRVPVVAWREAAGLRVQGRFAMDAQDLVQVYHMSRWALGLGVIMHRWKVVYLGLDLVLREAGS
jgi:polyisoprenoid-binding protein YceI